MSRDPFTQPGAVRVRDMTVAEWRERLRRRGEPDGFDHEDPTGRDDAADHIQLRLFE